MHSHTEWCISLQGVMAPEAPWLALQEVGRTRLKPLQWRQCDVVMYHGVCQETGFHPASKSLQFPKPLLNFA